MGLLTRLHCGLWGEMRHFSQGPPFFLFMVVRKILTQVVWDAAPGTETTRAAEPNTDHSLLHHDWQCSPKSKELGHLSTCLETMHDPRQFTRGGAYTGPG